MTVATTDERSGDIRAGVLGGWIPEFLNTFPDVRLHVAAGASARESVTSVMASQSQSEFRRVTAIDNRDAGSDAPSCAGPAQAQQ